MKEKEWKPIVLADAARAGICRQYTGLLERCGTLTDFLQLYRRGADWSLKHNVPSLDMLRRFPEERLDLHGIFIDREFNGEVLMDRQVYIFHNCKGTIRTGLNIGKRIIPMLYMAHGCDLRLENANGCRVMVPIWLYDGSMVDGDGTLKLKCTTNE